MFLYWLLMRRPGSGSSKVSIHLFALYGCFPVNGITLVPRSLINQRFPITLFILFSTLYDIYMMGLKVKL